MDLESCRQSLRAHAPDLDVTTLELLGRGWDSEVWLVGQGLVAHFALTPETLDAFRLEAALLPIVAPAVAPLAVPRLELLWPGSAGDPRALALYTRLQGTALRPPAAAPDGEVLATDLALLLQRLHAVPLSALAGVPFVPPVAAWPDQVEAVADLVREVVWPHLAPADRRRVQSLVEAVLRSFAAGPAPLRLLHGDLTADNLRVDDAGRLTGLLDFGDALVGDPAFDLRTLPSEVGPELARAVVRRYDDALWPRVVLYARLLPLERALFAIAHDDERLAQAALATFGKDPFASL